MAGPRLFGLLFPFQRDQQKDFAAGSGDALLQSKIAFTLSTVAQSPTTSGELPWNPLFGSVLDRLRHKNNNIVLQEEARALVLDALRKWVPSAQITRAVFTKETVKVGQDALVLSLRYDRVDPRSGNIISRGIEQLIRL